MAKKSKNLKVVKEAVAEIKADNEEPRAPFIVEDVAQILIDSGPEGMWSFEVQELTGQTTPKLARQSIRKCRYYLAELGYQLISVATDPEQYEGENSRYRIYKAVKNIPKDEEVRQYAMEA